MTSCENDRLKVTCSAMLESQQCDNLKLAEALPVKLASRCLAVQGYWLLSVVVAVLGCVLYGAQQTANAESDEEFFEKRIRPLLADRCEACHSASQGKASGGLVLDTRAGWQRGGDSGAVVEPQKPEESLLIQAVRYVEGGPQMPPRDKGGQLAETEIAALVEWVRRGAPDTRVAAPRIGGMTREEVAGWWSFQKVSPPPLPAVAANIAVLSKIDSFLIATLEQQGLSAAPPAERRTLLRRATFDLTGLPPTVAETADFLNDSADDAFERVIDRLLASPAYGQRWARHWLDVVRYADYYDSNPKMRTASCEITEAWRYRDWVVEAFNEDVPYDRFIVHQIAGDLLPDPTGRKVYPAGLIATTFLSNGVWDRGDADKEKIVSDMVDDNIDTIGKAFLGLTLGCARCHDHKFDPILTEDYYSLAGIFYSTHFLQDLGAKGAEYTMNRVPLAEPEIVERRNQQLQELAGLQASLEELDKQIPVPPADDPHRVQLTARRSKLQAELLPEPPLAIAVQEGGTPGGLFPKIQDVPIHIRGSYARLGPVAPRRMPKFLAGEAQSPITRGSGRLELANWIASPDNPLTARVIVNRVWQWHFGEGLVRSPSNFGKLGELPTHPELLDHLAAQFVADGWSLKRLHRRIMLSAAYRQSSQIGHEQFERDPENRWLGRFSRRRLAAEEIRDAILSVAGQLDLAAGGPAGDDFTIARRSLYVQTARWDRSSFATLFDAANPDSSTEKRTVSTVAPQALLLLNHNFILAQAQHVADRVAQEQPTDSVTRIRYAYQLLFGRDPSAEEMAIAQQIVAGSDPTVDAKWLDLAHVLLCSNEFLYLD